MIDPKKIYRTANGLFDVSLGDTTLLFHYGAIRRINPADNNLWITHTWYPDGKDIYGDEDFDLVEAEALRP